MQNRLFYRKNGFDSSFYKIDFKVVTNWSDRLEKHHTIEMLLMVDFYTFLEMLHFSKENEIFEIHK